MSRYGNDYGGRPDFRGAPRRGGGYGGGQGGGGADGFIVGSALKEGGRWSGAVDRGRVERFMAAHARCGG